MTPEEYVQQKATRSGSSFYYAFLFLPPPRRAAITAFYAFCREVDDIVDEVSDPGVAATKLAWWRGEVAASFGGHPSHPVMQALMPHASGYGIAAAQLDAVTQEFVRKARARAELALDACQHGRYDDGIAELKRLLRRGGFVIAD